MWCLNSSINLESPRVSSVSRRTVLFKEQKRRNYPMRRFIVINGEDEALFGESVCLNCERSIIDGEMRCVHVVHAKRRVVSLCVLDLHWAVLIDRKVHRSR